MTMTMRCGLAVLLLCVAGPVFAQGEFGVRVRDGSQAGEADVVNVTPTTEYGLVVRFPSLPTGDNTLGRFKLTDGTNLLTITATGAAKVDGSAVTQPVSGTVTATQGAPPWAENLTQVAGVSLAAPFDLDSGAGTQNVAGVSLRKSASGGSVELGTAADPVRTDPTGTTTQPVSGTITASQGTAAGVSGAWPAKVTDGTDTAQVTATGGGSLQVECAAGCGGGTQYAEDTAAAAGEQVTMAGVVRKDTAASLVDLDGDRTELQVDASGRLWVNGSGVTQPVSGTVTANAGSGTFTISGTVTANAGTNLNTSALALDATLTGRLPAGSTPADNESNAVTTSRVGAFLFCFDGTTWDRCPGNSTDGLLVNLGANNDVTVTSGTITATQSTAANLKAQVQGEAASGAAKAGNPVQVGGVFNTTQPTVTTGQAVEAQATARGALIVAKGVDGFALDANQSINVAQVAGTTTATNNGVVGAGVQRVTIASDSTGQLGLVPLTSGGLSLSRTVSAATTNATNVKASAGQVFKVIASNVNAAARFVHLYNTAGTPTCTASIVATFIVPGNTAGAGTNVDLNPGAAFGTGIGFCITTANDGTGAVAASDVVLTVAYK